MGYVSSPFKTEEPNPDTERVALSAYGGTMGRMQAPSKTSRGESSRRDAKGHNANACDLIPWYYHRLREQSLQDRRT